MAEIRLCRALAEASPAARAAVLAAWMTLIFYLSSQPGEQSAGLSMLVCRAIASVVAASSTLVDLVGITAADPVTVIAQALHALVRKAAHMTEYAILAALLWWTLRTRLAALAAAATALPLAFAYAASDELHQTFIPMRAGMFTDVLIDTAGAALCLALILAVRSCRQP